MKSMILDNFECYFPFIAKNVQDYKENGPFELIVKLTDGGVFSYNDLDKTIRKLPSDSDLMTEQECRNEFGIRLRGIMYRKGVTQSELSEKTGINKVTISKYITGHVSPSFYVVDKIAKALDCSMEELRYDF